MNIGALMLAAGVYFFKSTNHFVTGGVSGLSIALSFVIKVSWLNQSVLMLIINCALLIVGFIFLGRGCTIKTVWCSLIYSLENFLFEQFIALEEPLTSQPVLELCYAILLTGIGSAMMFNVGASSGGTDIIAMILKKHTSLNVGRALLVVDVLIAASSFFIFDIETGLYSMIGLFAKAFLIDGVIESIGKTKYITVITSYPEDIEDYIINNIKHTYTSYKATGGYTGEEKTVLITVCKRGEAFRLKQRVKERDSEAFVIITDANEILGKGFREN